MASLDSKHKEKLASIEHECEQMVLCQYQECQKLKEDLESLKNVQQETKELLENAECEIHQQ